MNKKFRSFNFWLGLSSAILILIQAVLKPFGIQLNEDVYTSVINAVLGVFVVLGIISKTNNDDSNNQQS